MTENLNSIAIDNFRNYIRIRSISNETDYKECVNFLQEQAKILQLECTVLTLKPNKPVVIMTWIGTNPYLPKICLNSHMDVVPVEENKWIYPPFSAHMDETGRIYGRGTQDMKNVGIQYLEAIRYLKFMDVRLTRSIVVTFVPDEEIGGEDGMKLFVHTPEFRSLNIAFGLDEACGSEDPHKFFMFYGERHNWSMKFHITGEEGHGSVNMDNTAAEKLSRLLTAMYKFREEQINKTVDRKWDSDVTSLNVTQIIGGQQNNVIPSEFTVIVDCRLHPHVNIPEWQQTIQGWCEHAGEGIWVEDLVCQVEDKPSAIDSTNPFYQPFIDGIAEKGYEVKSMICIACTDARFMRNLGIPVFGFSPITSTSLVHKHNENIHKKEFLMGIHIYASILQKIGNVP